METEIEAKFLDINVQDLRSKLASGGAELIHEERLMRRKPFDYPDRRLEKIGGWIRLRDEVDKITFTYKQLVDRTVEGTKEVSVDVSNFEKTGEILKAIGLVEKSYQETRREKWKLNEVEVTMDTWPWIPTFVELEGPSENHLKKVASALGLDWNKALFGSVENAYQAYYNVTEEEVDGWDQIQFGPVPDWLQSKAKT